MNPTEQVNLSMFRHPPSLYDQTRMLLNDDKRYQGFIFHYTQDVNRFMRTPRLLRVFVRPSKETRQLAQSLTVDERYKRWPKDLGSPVIDTEDGTQIGLLLRKDYLKDQADGVGGFKLPDRIFYSDATRAHNMMNGMVRAFPELAEHLKSIVIFDAEGIANGVIDRGRTRIKDARLRGKDYGDVSQYPEEKIYLALHPRQWKRYHRYGVYSETRYRPPNGENIIPDLFKRIENWKMYIERNYSPSETIWVITHSDVILAFQTITSGFSTRRSQEDGFLELREIAKPEHGSRTDFVREQTGRTTQYIYLGRKGLLE